jgi:hypothetical protein
VPDNNPGSGPSTLELPNDFWLQKEFYEGMILERLDYDLEWMNFLPRIFSNSESIVGMRDNWTADSDPRKRLPPLRGAGSRFVRIGISALEEVDTIMASRGFEFAVSERTLRYQYNIDEGLKALTRCARWLAMFVNTQLISELVDATSGVTVCNGAADTSHKFYDRTVKKWSESDANPLEDMLLMTDDMEDMSAGYTPTDWYVYKTNFQELRNRLIDLDVDLDSKRNLYGLPTAKADYIDIPALGGRVHKVRYGMIEGDVLCIDRNMAPGTYYHGRNARYAPTLAVTTDEGTTINNDYGLHSHRFFDDKTHEEVVQLWLENAILIKDPFSGLFQATGAKGI